MSVGPKLWSTLKKYYIVKSLYGCPWYPRDLCDALTLWWNWMKLMKCINTWDGLEQIFMNPNDFGDWLEVCGFERNSSTIGWIAMNFGSDINAPHCNTSVIPSFFIQSNHQVNIFFICPILGPIFAKLMTFPSSAAAVLEQMSSMWMH